MQRAAVEYVFELCRPRQSFMDRELQENTLDEHLEDMLETAWPTTVAQRN